MADWSLEGHFVCGGAGLYVSTDCLGHSFQTRTASQDMTLSLPTIDAAADPVRVVPPDWSVKARWPEESENERNAIQWGAVPGYSAEETAPGSHNLAIVTRCGFLASVSADSDEEYFAAADAFAGELDDWWDRFTSWVGILASQDFVRLAGYPRRGIKSGPVWMWTADTEGKRMGSHLYHPLSPNRSAMYALELDDLRAVIATTGSQKAPPAEWLLIRDARSLMAGGDFRRAVLDAATAAEIAIVALINKKYDDSGTSQADRDAAFAKARGLSKLVGLYNQFKQDKLSQNLIDHVGRPRNTAIHSGVPMTDAQARAAIVEAITVVEMASPLATLIPR